MKNQNLETREINKESLEDVLREALNKALNFGWSGWRIPIYLEDDGTVTLGGWASQGQWQPDEIELPVRVESWEMPNDYGENPDEADISEEVNRRVEFETNRIEEYFRYYPEEYPYQWAD